MPPEICPVCGADVPPKARACSTCGADERTGWNEEETAYDGIDLPDEGFDYEQFLENEGLKTPRQPRATNKATFLVAIIILIAFIAYFVF